MLQRNFPSYLFFGCLLVLGHSQSAFGQYDYTVVKPRERAATERVAPTRKATQSTKGILVVLLEPVIGGKITVTDARGKLVDEIEADKIEGRADIELKRGQSYLIKAASPGFLGNEVKTKFLKSGQPLRLKLTAQYARLYLPGLPVGANVFIDDQLKATADNSGQVLLANLEPGKHKLLVRHTEYNDYAVPLPSLEPGAEVSFPLLSTLLVKVAKLTLQSLPNATVLIDGAVQGRVNADGQVKLDYELPQAGEHVVSFELIGHQTWSQKIMLAPGPLTINATLTPIVTSVGESDQFDSPTLSRWAAPDSWKVVTSGPNNRLQISGDTLGLLKDKLYRNFEVHFTVWLTDGKGATWAVRADKAGKRYYLFQLAGATPAEGLTSRRFYTYLMQDGVLTEVSSPVTVLTKLNNKDSYLIHLTVKEHVITHEITSNSDGATNDLGIYTDTTTTKERSLYGTFGFRSFKGEVFQVDDFTLAPLP